VLLLKQAYAYWGLSILANLGCSQYKMNYTGLEQQSKESQIAELELFIKSVMDSRELKRAISVNQ
jgi:hypothetical protein